jgi:hypothetical protein
MPIRRKFAQSGHPADNEWSKSVSQIATKESSWFWGERLAFDSIHLAVLGLELDSESGGRIRQTVNYNCKVT